MIKKVVLDANIFVSAILVSDSNAAKILDLARGGELELLISPGIFDEIARVLHYPKIKKRHRRTPQELQAFLKKFTEFATVVAGESKIEMVQADPDDDKYLACAMEGSADLIVSGDHHLTDLGAFQGIRIVSPKEFLDLVRKEDF
jgi:putative PIN family toxin of toxin-antitoxin system